MRRFLSLTLSLILLAGCSPSQPADRQVDLSQPPAQSLEVPPPPPQPSNEEKLLTEIRDLLKEKG